MNGNDNETAGKVNEVKGRAQQAPTDLTDREDDRHSAEVGQARRKSEQFTGDVKNAVNDLTN